MGEGERMGEGEMPLDVHDSANSGQSRDCSNHCVSRLPGSNGRQAVLPAGRFCLNRRGRRGPQRRAVQLRCAGRMHVRIAPGNASCHLLSVVPHAPCLPAISAISPGWQVGGRLEKCGSTRFFGNYLPHRPYQAVHIGHSSRRLCALL